MQTRIAFVVIGAALFAGQAALSQQEVDPDQFEQGKQLYELQCAVCHQDDGSGIPPNFPALNTNPNLEALDLIVRNVHQGEGDMPPFPDLDAEQISQVASYIRNAWSNQFGAAPVEEVVALLEGLEAAAPRVSVWDGVYTEEQAARGASAYSGTCSTCHGRRLNGAPDDPDMRSTPPLARATFLREWDGSTVAALFQYTRTTMPLNNPGYMSDQRYLDIIAHMFSVSGMPAGETELMPDAPLASIVIEPE